MQLIASPAAPVTLGASTNQDYIVVLNRQAVPLFIGEVSIEVQNLGGSATAMKASVIARQYAALGTGRRPQGIALVQGAVAPAF